MTPKLRRGEENKEPVTPSVPEVVDYDQAALDLFNSLGIDDPKINKQKYSINEPDVVYVHPNGGKLFVGGHVPSSTIEILEKYKIFHIVNCKGNDG